MRSNFIIFLAGFLPAVFAAFGITTSGSRLIVDSGAGLVTQGWQTPFFHFAY
jgi:hypothetical protein